MSGAALPVRSRKRTRAGEASRYSASSSPPGEVTRITGAGSRGTRNTRTLAEDCGFPSNSSRARRCQTDAVKVFSQLRARKAFSISATARERSRRWSHVLFLLCGQVHERSGLPLPGTSAT